jgi:DNA-binding NarL/FixJ family response regulator
MSVKDSAPFKVLLVEDNEDFRRNFAGLLRSRFSSMVIEEAADGTEAMEKVESFLPHLIFMDIKLPGQNGLEITKRIKAIHPRLNVVFLTSYDYPEYREAARACGAYYFLGKGSSTSQQIQDVVEGLWTK